jgi:HEAT repeat protein
MSDEPTGVLSPDFVKADQALTEAIGRRDAGQVARALEHPAVDIKLKAARALGAVGDRTSVPRLADALENNQVCRAGGSEERILQNDLNAALVASLAKLTGLDFGAPASEEDLKRVAQAARQWLRQAGG